MHINWLIGVATTTDSGELDPNAIVEETAKKMSAFSRYWQSINWDSILSSLISKGISLGISLIILLIIKKAGTALIEKGFKKYHNNPAYSTNRIETLQKLTHNTFIYLLYFILAYTLLTIVGVPVSSLIAGAGIAGIAIGLGAQGFINDLLTGFFIILERQMDVGDYVQIDNYEGTVLAVGLRTTQIKGPDGTVHFIPNRQILIVSNKSRSDMRALIQIHLKPSTDIEKVSQIIQTTNQKLLPAYPEITTSPVLLGLSDLGNGQVVFKVMMYTLNGAQFKVQADFLAAYMQALTEEGIEIPQLFLPTA